MADPRWRIQDGGHQNDHFISNMNFICKIACVPKIYIQKIDFRFPLCQKSIFTPSGTVFSKFIALELLRVRFFGKIQIRILVSKNGFCVSLPKSENGLITD